MSRGPGRLLQLPGERQQEIVASSVGLPNAGNRTLHHPILGPRNWGPRKSPAKRVLWGEDEQGSEHDFRRQAETEWSGLCEDEGGPGVQAL